MKTQRQAELVNAFLRGLEDQDQSLYQELILHLSELGYHPKKEGSNLSFKHDLHNKQMAKIGIRTSKKGARPFFALRFSACEGYSKRFVDVVNAYMTKYPARTAKCPGGGCQFCAGEALTHVYHYNPQSEERQAHCGAYAIEIPDMAMQDAAEIKSLITQEHAYLMAHEG